jgi:hypothetical protein
MKQITLGDSSRKKKYVLQDIDQFDILKKICDNSEINNDFNSELKKKYNAYKNQDKQKHKFDDDKHITYNQMVQKLYESKLKCYYCNCDLFILFNKKRENSQWTLERLDNNLGHYESNTCIACLKCNLHRRTDSHEYFKQGKQLILIKLD